MGRRLPTPGLMKYLLMFPFHISLHSNIRIWYSSQDNDFNNNVYLVLYTHCFPSWLLSSILFVYGSFYFSSSKPGSGRIYCFAQHWHKYTSHMRQVTCQKNFHWSEPFGSMIFFRMWKLSIISRQSKRSIFSKPTTIITKAERWPLLEKNRVVYSMI